MASRSNFVSEPVKPEETLTFLVGQSQLPGTPSLNLIYEEPGCRLFLADAGTGELTFHADIIGTISITRLKHLEQLFLQVVLGLFERGMEEIPTWVEYGNEKQRRFAEFFGFESSGFLRKITMEDGSQLMMEEMFYTIPLEREID